MIDAAPEQIAVHGRVILQRARALLADGQADAARALLEAGIEVPDLREGETLGGAVARGVRRPAAAVPLRLPDASRPRPLRVVLELLRIRASIRGPS